MTDETQAREQHLKAALENSPWQYPDQIEVVARLDDGITLLNETAGEETAVVALAEITGNPISRRLLEKAAVRFWDETQRPRLYRLSSKEGNNGLRQLIEEVAELKIAFGFAGHHAQKFADAASKLGLVPEEVSKARGNAAFFKIKEFEEALRKIEAALIEEFGEEKGSVAVSERILGQPFDHFTYTLASLWRDTGRDFGRDAMRDFETVLNALMEGLTKKNMPANRWKILKRELKK